MNATVAIQWIGASHLLQPPITLVLAKRFGLADAFAGLAPLAAQIARNMGFAAVVLPTSMGVLVGLQADDVVAGGGARHLAWLVSAFWTWRLYRQRTVGRHFPRVLEGRAWNWLLAAIFFVQGPLLAIVLVYAKGC